MPSAEAMNGPCPACGATDATPWAKAHDVEYCTSDEEYAFFRCGGCGVLFIDPIPADRLREIYPANYYSYAPQGQSLVYRVKGWFDRRFFRKLLGQLAAPSLRVLDVGGGAGWELSALRASDGRVTATCIVDLDPDAAAAARQNGHDYFCGRIESFETDQKFDLVMLLNLIEHVQDPGAVLRKVASLLAPGGRVVIKTPNYDAWDARLFRRRNWAGYHTPRHWVLFTRESFTALAQRSGFVVREASYTQGAPFWAASVLAWLAARGLLRVTKERPVVFHPLFGVTAALFAALDLARRPFARTSQMFFTLGL
jgi:2-polyprenyl-3-methyl-5-hydroxy-6-metoxy-1,4-benzoquinol methylase